MTDNKKIDKNDVTGETVKKGKDSYYLSKKEEMRDAIINSFNDSVDKGKAIWEMPIFEASFMNPASGVVYGPLNSAYISSQLNRKRIDIQLKEYHKIPVLSERIKSLFKKAEFFGDIFGVIAQIRKEGSENEKIGKALKIADKEISNKEISPYFMTYNQLKNTYSNFGSSAFHVLHVFPVQIKKANKEDVEDLKNNADESQEFIVESISEENKKEEQVISFNLPGKMSRTVTRVFNYSDLKVKKDLEEPKGILRRMEMFEKTVEDEEIKTIIESLVNVAPFPVMRVTDKKSSAFFSESLGVINVAPTKYFKSSLEELHTIAHEVAHSFAGAANIEMKGYKKYKRECYDNYHSMDKKYRAEEELVANVGATMLLTYFNIRATEEDRMEAFNKNHEVYDHGWAGSLKADHKAVYRAVDMADKIVRDLSFKIMKDLTLRFEKNPDLPLPAFIKDSLETKQRKQKLDETVRDEFCPTFKEETVMKKQHEKDKPYRRGRSLPKPN